MKILILTNREYSHIYGTKQFINSILDRNHQVTMYVGKAYTQTINKHDNLIIKSYPKEIFEKNRAIFHKEYSNYIKMDREAIYRSSNKEWAKIHNDTLEYHVRASENYISKILDNIALEKSDIILRNSCSLFARKIADYLNIPCIGYATSLIVPSSIFLLKSSYGYDMSKRSDEEIDELIKLFIQNTKRISKKYTYICLQLSIF